MNELKKAAVRTFMMKDSDSEPKDKDSAKEEFKKVLDKMIKKGKIVIMEGGSVQIITKEKVKVNPLVDFALAFLLSLYIYTYIFLLLLLFLF